MSELVNIRPFLRGGWFDLNIDRYHLSKLMGYMKMHSFSRLPNIGMSEGLNTCGSFFTEPVIF